MELVPTGPVKPRLRGVLHEYAFFVSLACGAALVLAASDGRARLAALIYAGAVSALLGTSALYHRVTWRPTARR
jgi:hemolysin III